VILSNGVIEATINKGGSTITSIKLGRNEMASPGKPVYYSIGSGKSYRQPTGAVYRIVKQTTEVADIAFLQKWKSGSSQAVDIEVHYAPKRGESGFHTGPCGRRGNATWKPMASRIVQMPVKTFQKQRIQLRK
jgi:hypothetical protein